jgi:hypothetical protein
MHCLGLVSACFIFEVAFLLLQKRGVACFIPNSRWIGRSVGKYATYAIVLSVKEDIL